MRRLWEILSVLSFGVAVLLVMSQVLLWVTDILVYLNGDRPLLFVIAGTGGVTAFNIVLTLWLYCSFTAYAAFWFVAGMGLRQLSSHASE